MAGHAHGETRSKAGNSLKIAAAITACLCLAEVAGGFLSNSLSLVSDAGHMFTDLVAQLLVLFSMYWATKPASPKKTYGYYRIEILAALINGALLFFIAFQIVWEAVHRFRSPGEIRADVMLSVAFLGLVANMISAWILHGKKEHLATRSAYYHVMSDLISSVGVVIAGAVVFLTGWKTADPLMSVAIAALILLGARRLVKEALDVLMEAAPTHIKLDDVRRAILGVKGVEDIHDLHVWTISSGFLAASAHLRVYPMDTRSGDHIVQQVSVLLQEKFSIAHTTMQIESLPAPAQIEKIPN